VIIRSDKHTRRLWITTADLHRVTGEYIDREIAQRILSDRWILMWRRIGLQVARQVTKGL